MAVTRARRHLALVGDSSTISHEPFIRGLIEYCTEHGEVRSAHEYIHSKWIHYILYRIISVYIRYFCRS